MIPYKRFLLCVPVVLGWNFLVALATGHDLIAQHDLGVKLFYLETDLLFGLLGGIMMIILTLFVDLS